MRFSLGRSLVRILLLALFVTCVGLYITTGQASAHSSWDSGCDSNGHDHSDSSCSSYDRNDGYYSGNYNYDGNYGGSHSYNVSDNCDQWDPKTGYCVHWKLDIPNGPVYDSAYPGNGNHGGYYYQDNYHDANYYYKYYCDRYGCNCN